MDTFKEIPDALAVLCSKGLYTQNPLYVRGRSVYAKRGSGFVRLYQGGATSLPSVSWKDLDPGNSLVTQDRFYLIYNPPTAVVATEKLAQIPAE